MKILEKKYKEWNIYFSDEKEKLGEKILNHEYEIFKTLKDTKRNYVAIISIENKKYILKSFRSEVIIPQRKLQTFFKKGESLSTLENSLEVISEGLTELVKPMVALVKKKAFIEESYLLMEYLEGRKLQTVEDVDEVIKVTKKIHNLKRYHGDLNTSNFIMTESGIRILDTQMKEEKYIFYKRSYDILTLKEDLLVQELNYPVEEKYGEFQKDIGYILAKFIKNSKKLKIVKTIKGKKKELRKKGWKI